MKLLFICSNNFKTNSGGGGSQCTNRNYLSFCDILGEDNVDVVQFATSLGKNLYSILSRFRNYSRGYNAGLSKQQVTSILEQAFKYNYIFIDSSYYGILCKYLKKNNYKGQILCFFHNVEHKMYLQEVRANPLKFWRSFIIYYNEKNAVKFSDQVIVLNERDLMELGQIYKKLLKFKTHVIPISFKDSFPAGEIDLQEQSNLPPVFLFVGSDWFANVHGITWFVKEVLDNVDIKLQIAGSASNVLKKKFVDPKIEYLGFVPDLSSVIMNADFILAPLFKGGGMKVKICEALMYGKNIVGTKEAFVGYNLDLNKTGAECNNKSEFIHVLKKCSSSKRLKFNMYNRNRFLESYSFAATLEKFKKVLQNSEVPASNSHTKL
ncbi:glycosyl transferase family 1 [Gillisia sp. Hel_I_86]|uniref:glycosyltransferase n=1 Tax=Gillisia sp. Hel_I_86 TaxID=1249981 RepID=UPI0011992CE3|nr:glycosyltransferase family 4 protein [Gillisia sp. Hel_I_86]TVZ27528.1 glycosyl transferase family 1 [Gillisia sp. Hel_I_86]